MNQLIAWVEIPSADFERAVKFYSPVFQLDLKPPFCGLTREMVMKSTQMTQIFRIYADTKNLRSSVSSALSFGKTVNHACSFCIAVENISPVYQRLPGY